MTLSETIPEKWIVSKCQGMRIQVGRQTFASTSLFSSTTLSSYIIPIEVYYNHTSNKSTKTSFVFLSSRRECHFSNCKSNMKQHNLFVEFRKRSTILLFPRFIWLDQKISLVKSRNNGPMNAFQLLPKLPQDFLLGKRVSNFPPFHYPHQHR